MRYLHHLASLTLACVLFCSLMVSQTAAKEQRHSVSARVTHASGLGVGIQAQKQPGHFTVPEGHFATALKYRFHDPNSNFSSHQLSGSNIYSVTQGCYISEAASNPNVKLPAGKYKFVVGGRAGASGTLSFSLTSTTTKPDSSQPVANDMDLPHNFDVTVCPLMDLYMTIPEEGRQQWNTIMLKHKCFDIPDQVIFHFRNGRVSAEWSFRYAAPHLHIDHTSRIEGMFSKGHFTGTDTGRYRHQMTNENGSVSWENGMVWSLRGKADANGLLILHGRWQSDSGQQPEWIPSGSGKGTWRLKPYTSHASARATRSEWHLRLPVGQQPSHVERSEHRPAVSGVTSEGQRSPSAAHNLNHAPGNSIWDQTTPNGFEDAINQLPGLIQPTGTDTDANQPINIWDNSSSTSFEDAATDSDDALDNLPEVDTADSHNLKIGTRLSDDKIWYKPPWDEGGAYAMDKEEVQAIRKREGQGFRWDKRHGWVNDERRKEIDNIGDIERRNDEQERMRSRIISDNLAGSKERADQHAQQAKRFGDIALMQKVKSQGWQSLTDDERAQLSKVDDDIKNHLRGDSKTIKGYERGFVDDHFSQGTIDTTHKILQGTKVAIDETMNVLESKTGPVGKAISKTYTITSKIAESASQANADYHAGKTDKLDYDTAVTEGFKKGVTSVVIDEISGELSNHVTDRFLDSKAGKQAADYIENRANQARKQATRDFVSGKSDTLNARLLDDAADATAKKAKQNVNYAIGRTTKPAYDATVGQPVKDAVDWTIDTEVPK